MRAMKDSTISRHEERSLWSAWWMVSIVASRTSKVGIRVGVGDIPKEGKSRNENIAAMRSCIFVIIGLKYRNQETLRFFAFSYALKDGLSLRLNYF